MYSQTTEVILSRMLATIPPGINKEQGSFVHDALVAAAEELSAYSDSLNDVYIRTSAALAAEYGYSDDLDRWCQNFGITRKIGTKATGTVKITASIGTELPLGLIVQTDNMFQYRTTQSLITSQAETIIAVEAIEVGAQYNGVAVTGMATFVQGVTACVQQSANAGGTDTETDADLYARLFAKLSKPSTSGNANDYYNWALETTGVGGAKVIPIWSGAGTVKVILIDQNKAPAAAGIVSAVAANIEAKRPIGAAVTVVAATSLAINVVANITKKSGYLNADVTAAINAAIDTHIKAAAFKSSQISYAQMTSIILDAAGVADVTNLTINGGTANISVGADQVAIKGTVTLNVT